MKTAEFSCAAAAFTVKCNFIFVSLCPHRLLSFYPLSGPLYCRRFNTPSPHAFVPCVNVFCTQDGMLLISKYLTMVLAESIVRRKVKSEIKLCNISLSGVSTNRFWRWEAVASVNYWAC